MLGLDIIDEYSRFGDEEMRRILRRIHKNSSATVVHHETCPCCGAKLVNLYARDKKDGYRLVKEWKCRRCWEKIDADPQPAIKMGEGKLYMVTQDGTHIPLGSIGKED